ncbi:MAG TPA: hypothetical protein VLA97_13450 [Nocardioidaceae bacterium]|nr:hypothetical protein [Nocardioidaceae bacterium]
MSTLTGLGPLIRFALRRDRVFLPVWVLSLVGITYATANAVASTYNTPAEIQAYAANLGTSPATIAMAGPPVALEQIGGILIYETSMTALLGTALMSVFLVVRHTRSEEEAGRTELLSSTVVAPQAGPVAALVVALAAGVLVGLGVTWSLLSVDSATGPALLFGAAVAAMGWVFAGVALVAAQLTTHARGSIGIGLAALGVAFGLRAVGDTSETFWSWLSPMGWSQQVRVFDDNRWWPLLLSVALTALLFAAAAVLSRRRDLGAGIVQPRPGPASARSALCTPLGLAWRLQRASILGWTVGILVTGLMFGSVTEEMRKMVEDNPTLAAYFERIAGASLVDAFFSTAMLIMGILAAGFAVASALRMRAEETSGRLEPVLSTGVSRSRWYAASAAVTLVGTVLAVAAGGLGVGIAYAAVSGDGSAVWRLTGYVLVYLPAVLVLVGVALLLVGWVPRAAAAAWAALAVCFVVGWLGGILSFPSWFENLSPFTHTPAVPAEELTAGPLLVIAAVAAAAAGLGLAGFLRRDVGRA